MYVWLFLKNDIIIFEIEIYYELQAKELREVILAPIAILIGFLSHVPPMESGQQFKVIN